MTKKELKRNKKKLICPICNRTMDADCVSKHHLKPQARLCTEEKNTEFGHTNVVWLHPRCHAFLHMMFNSSYLYCYLNTITKLKEHSIIQMYVVWATERKNSHKFLNKDIKGWRKKNIPSEIRQASKLEVIDLVENITYV